MLREIQSENKLTDYVVEDGVPKEDEEEYSDNQTINSIIDEVVTKVNSLICLECGKQFHRYISYKQHWGKISATFGFTESGIKHEF